MKKRVIALLLTVVMVCSLLPVAAFAADAQGLAGGTCGKNATWTLDTKGVLTISGTGAIDNYTIGSVSGKTPWYSNRNSIRSLVIKSGITSIGCYAFYELGNLESAVIPSSVKRIKGYAFSFCYNLEKLTVMSGLTRVDEEAFSHCTKLTDIPLPDTVTYIGVSAFDSCNGIVNLTIPDGVTTIDDYAFANCKNMETLSLGANVTSIGYYAFNDSPIKDIYFKGTSDQYKAITKGSGNFSKPTIHYNHTHEYSFAGTVAPTCTEKGYDKYLCSGGEYKCENYVKATGHTVAVEKGYPATYESTGLSDKQYCSVCGTVIEDHAVIPKLVDNYESVYITNLDRPKAGNKLDYSFGVSSTPKGGIVSEGDKAPTIEWYTYNEQTGKYDKVSDTSYICAARGYMAYVYLTPTEHSGFDYTYFWLNGNILGEFNDGFRVTKLSDGRLRLRMYFNASEVSSVEYTDMPYACVVGDKVADFRPATLNSDGTRGTYFWYIEKYNSKGEVVGAYIAKDQAATACEQLGLSSKEITELRKDFGTTFKSAYSYVLCNFEILDYDHVYDKSVNIKVSFRNGEKAAEQFDGRPNGIKTGVSATAILLDTMKVSKPAAPVIKISTSGSKIKLSWYEVPGADKYYIYRSTDGKNYKYYSSTTKLTYTNSSVTGGTKYYYKVKAVNVVGDNTYVSKYSNAKSALVLTPPVVKASLSDGLVKISWDKVTGATKYEVYRATRKTGSYSKVYTTTKTSYKSNSVKEGSTYYYKVKAIKTVGSTNYTSDSSSIQSVMILKTPTLTAANNNGKVKLSWGAVSGADKYYVYRSTDNKTFKYLGSTTKTSYTNSKVTAGTKYYYKVKAVNADGGTSKLSFAKSVVPKTVTG